MKPSNLRLVIAISIIGCLSSSASSAQRPDAEPKQRFRSSADVVTIQASVRNNRGRPMQGLTSEDFEVRDNGQVRPILSLRSDLRLPVSLALLVDMSGSMAVASKIAMARLAFESVLSQLHPGQDEVAVFTFDARLHERRPFTAALGQLRGWYSTTSPPSARRLFTTPRLPRHGGLPSGLPRTRRSSFSPMGSIPAAR